MHSGQAGVSKPGPVSFADRSAFLMDAGPHHAADQEKTRTDHVSFVNQLQRRITRDVGPAELKGFVLKAGLRFFLCCSLRFSRSSSVAGPARRF